MDDAELSFCMYMCCNLRTIIDNLTQTDIGYLFLIAVRWTWDRVDW